MRANHNQKWLVLYYAKTCSFYDFYKDNFFNLFYKSSDEAAAEGADWQQISSSSGFTANLFGIKCFSSSSVTSVQREG